MTRKDYKVLAKAIRKDLPVFQGFDRRAVVVFTAQISRRLVEDNPQFNQELFLRECGILPEMVIEHQ